MTGVRLELDNPNRFSSETEYIENHLVPVASELHRITNELLSPGSTTAEEWAVDMCPWKVSNRYFARLDRYVDPRPKHVVFDGAECFSIPKELLRSKQLKVQLNATVYIQHEGAAQFRLAREDGTVIEGSTFDCGSSDPATYGLTLPFSEQLGCITPDKQTYVLEARQLSGTAIPVCRRFSLAFVYI